MRSAWPVSPLGRRKLAGQFRSWTVSVGEKRGPPPGAPTGRSRGHQYSSASRSRSAGERSQQRGSVRSTTAAPQAAGPLVPLACPLLATEVARDDTSKSDDTTGAATQRPATLWLCDVEDLDDEVQQQLVRELAGNRTFRMIATSREPAAVLAGAGKFRVDLAWPLATIEIPASRRSPEPIEDLPLLTQLFVEEQIGKEPNNWLVYRPKQ